MKKITMNGRGDACRMARRKWKQKFLVELEKLPAEQVKSLLFQKLRKPLYENLVNFIELKTGRRYTRQHVWGVVSRKHNSYGRVIESIIYELIGEEPKE